MSGNKDMLEAKSLTFLEGDEDKANLSSIPSKDFS